MGRLFLAGLGFAWFAGYEQHGKLQPYKYITAVHVRGEAAQWSWWSLKWSPGPYRSTLIGLHWACRMTCEKLFGPGAR